MPDPLLQLSTTLAPAQVFTVDGVEYDLLTFDHIGEGQEAEVMSKFTMYGRYSQALVSVRSEKKAEAIADRLRKLRIEILCLLTSMPADVAGKVPVSAQLQLLELATDAVGISVSNTVDTDDELLDEDVSDAGDDDALEPGGA